MRRSVTESGSWSEKWPAEARTTYSLGHGASAPPLQEVALMTSNPVF